MRDEMETSKVIRPMLSLYDESGLEMAVKSTNNNPGSARLAVNKKRFLFTSLNFYGQRSKNRKDWRSGKLNLWKNES